MFDRDRKKPFDKINNTYNRRKDSHGSPTSTNEMKSAIQDSKKLKRHKKRLGIDWFFRPD